MSNRGKLSSRAPDKGSFPLDHFHECDKEAKEYAACMLKHENLPKRCRRHQVDYLQCRMKNGLMQQDDLEKLGMGPETSWETEEQEKRYLFDKIQKMKSKAWEEVQKKSQQPQQ